MEIFCTWGQLKELMEKRNASDDTELWIETQLMGDHPTIPARAHSGEINGIEFVNMFNHQSRVILKHKG